MTTSTHTVEIEGKAYIAYVSTTTNIEQPEPCPCGKELGYRWVINLEQLVDPSRELISLVGPIAEQITKQLYDKLSHDKVLCLGCRFRKHGAA